MLCRNISVNNLLYVKEDFIIPHAVTFHDLIRKKALGKRAMFDFGAHEDVRAHSDSRIENTESHAGNDPS
jgi:protein FAM50